MIHLSIDFRKLLFQNEKVSQHLTCQQARSVAYVLKLLAGLSTGFYILTYLVVIGDAGAPLFHLSPAVLGLAAIGFCFILEYFLEVPSGAEADIRGTRSTFIMSFVLRGFFPLLLIMTITMMTSNAWLLVIGTIVTMTTFAVAFTLFSGNFEQFLIAQCDEIKRGDKVFALSQGLFYIGFISGAAASLLLSSTIAFILSAFCSFLAALVCCILPREEKEKKEVSKRSDVMEQAFLDLKSHSILSTMFWMSSFIYGIHMLVEAIIPIVYLANIRGEGSAYSLQEKFIVLICGISLPYVLGSFSLIPKRKIENDISQSLRSLQKEMVLYCAACLLLFFAHHFSGFLQTGLFGLAVFFINISFGRLIPLFQSFNARLAQKMSQVPKTLLSIGEKRKKVASILTLFFPFFVGLMWDDKNGAIKENLYYAVIGVSAFFLVLYTFITFRKYFLANIQDPIPEQVQ